MSDLEQAVDAVDAGDAGDGAEDLPQTGEPAVDRALESLQGLESVPLAEHHERLARVHEELHRALNPE